MEEVFLIQRVPRLETSAFREIKSRPKLFGRDPGLVAALGRVADPLRSPRLKGRLAEAAVLRHLRDLATRAQARIVCGQRRDWRDQPLGEADFLLLSAAGIIVIEVTSADTPHGNKAAMTLRRIEEIKRNQGTKDVRGLIVYGGALRRRSEYELPWVPLPDFLEGILAGPAADPLAPLRVMSGEVLA